jgi:hypothetical protein
VVDEATLTPIHSQGIIPMAHLIETMAVGADGKLTHPAD